MDIRRRKYKLGKIPLLLAKLRVLSKLVMGTRSALVCTFLRTLRIDPFFIVSSGERLLVRAILLFTLVGALYELPVQGQVDWGGSRLSGRALAMPLYSERDTKPVAVVRFGGLGIDHQRRAFFRIGAMPVLKGEDVVLEVLVPALAAQALSQITNRVQSGEHYGAVEWRPFKILWPGQREPRLEAKQGSWSQHGGLSLTDVRVRLPGQAEFKVRHGYLVLTGPSAGRLYDRPSAPTPLCDLFLEVEVLHLAPRVP